MTYNEVCGDNRFELIEKYKAKLLDGTNIETAKDEMAVIDSILFRFWQMDWLDKLEQFDAKKSEVERLQNEIRFLHANDMTIAEKVKEQAKGYERGIKEFAERLKKVSAKRTRDVYGERIFFKDIDNLVKEMVGDDK